MADITLQEQQEIVDLLWMHPDFLADLEALNDWQQTHFLEIFREFMPPEDYSDKWEGDQFIGNFFVGGDEQNDKARELLAALRGYARQWMYKRFPKLLDAVGKIVPPAIVLQGIDEAARYRRLNPPQVFSTRNQDAWAVGGSILQLPSQANDHKVLVSSTAPGALKGLPLSMAVFWREDTTPDEIVRRVRQALKRMKYEPKPALHRWPAHRSVALSKTMAHYNVWREWVRLQVEAPGPRSDNEYYDDYLEVNCSTDAVRATASSSIARAMARYNHGNILNDLSKDGIRDALGRARALCEPEVLEQDLTSFLSSLHGGI